ncbi:MAG: 1-(5-phosphoribosyl)-5-[(5-phosphoribosylamino)methylideneamino]imidazole-4-carboxamide isomerase [Candidatus Omnitrophica bacterium]|nr:1-(5-phosphoribosyl)-5-[(5-phosphoribosylamino)methylideneamino]imidazole-4-carboxamide isomerase [Candidatus Omnitrophota bacterium]
MIIIPAIDIKDGCVVRLTQGDFKNKKIYSKDPVKTARYWASQGAGLIHVVDLDGASSGKPVNSKIIKEIARNVRVPVQCGGGIRSIQIIKGLLGAGIFRVVLGTKAVEDKDFLSKVFKQFKNSVIVSVDAKNGLVAVKGWGKALKGVDALEFGRDLKKVGFSQAIYTDISKDGTLKGPNIPGVRKFLKETGLGVIASGGISSLDDLRRLKLLVKDGLTGIIVGKALYEGRFTLQQALRVV